MSSELYDLDYYQSKYVSRLVVSFKLAHIYYLWLAFFCIILPAKLEKTHKVLDFGCGIGYLTWALRKLGIQAYGIDSSLSAQKLCLIPEFCTFTSTVKLPYPDNFFDLVITNEVLEHVKSQELKPLLKEIRRISKCYVINMISVRERGSLAIDEPTHFTVKNEDWWEKYFKKAGFSVKTGNFFYFFPYLFSKGGEWLAQKKGYFFLMKK